MSVGECWGGGSEVCLGALSEQWSLESGTLTSFHWHLWWGRASPAFLHIEALWGVGLSGPELCKSLRTRASLQKHARAHSSVNLLKYLLNSCVREKVRSG